MVEWFVAAVPENPVSRRKLLIAAGAGVAAVALIGSLWSSATSGAGETALAEPALPSSARLFELRFAKSGANRTTLGERSRLIDDSITASLEAAAPPTNW